ncbi:hypothetical protein [Nocardia sp. NPDC056000]|uniref:hypothetical protein n=1 Tax=Nocardia sp. NPDC056000 TaxID=3345674 RepID=UPI0035DBF19B
MAVHAAAVVEERKIDMDVVILVICIVLAALSIQLIWIPIVIHFRRKNALLDKELTASMAAESIIRPMERGIYRGSTVPGVSNVSNNGQIGLTARRLVFRTATSKLIEIPVHAITGAHESKVFNGAVRGGSTHLVVSTQAGDYGFILPNPSEWIATIDGLVERSH